MQRGDLRTALAFAACLTLASAGMGAEKPSGDSAPLPSAREIVDRSIKAMGGRDAFKEVKSEHIKGTYELPAQQIKGDLEVFSAPPNKTLINIQMPAVGRIATGYDGETAWMNNPATGPMILKGKQAEQVKEEADFYAVLHEPENYQSMETVGRTTFESQPAYQLKLVKKSGSETTEFYNVDSGMLIGYVGKQESPLGSMTVTNVLQDYKQFGKVKVPTKMIQRIGPIEQVIQVKSVDLNAVDESVFNLPPEIKAMKAAEGKESH